MQELHDCVSSTAAGWTLVRSALYCECVSTTLVFPSVMAAAVAELRQEIADRNYSETTLAQAVGVSSTTLNRQLNGVIAVRVETIEVLARILGLSLDELFRRARDNHTVTERVIPALDWRDRRRSATTQRQDKDRTKR